MPVMPSKQNLQPWRVLALVLIPLGMLQCNNERKAASIDTKHFSASSVVSKLSSTVSHRSKAFPSLETLALVWQSKATKEAYEYFKQGRWSEAHRGFSKEAERLGEARLMLAICDAKLGEHSLAAVRFVELQTVFPLLSNYLHYQAARSFYLAGNAQKAKQEAKQVHSDSIHQVDASFILGDILRGLGNADAIYTHYKDYLQTHPKGIRRLEATFYKAIAASQRGETQEALESFKYIAVHAPLRSWAKRSKQQSDALQSQRGQGSIQWSPEDHITHAMVLYKANRNKASEAGFARALQTPDLSIASNCIASYHLANSVYKQRNRARAAPLFLLALRSCQRANNIDLQVKSSYQAGRSYSSMGEHEKAITHFSRIERNTPEHSYADDARLHIAEEYGYLDKRSKEKEVLGSIANIYPKGDMRAEALWRLAWLAYKDKHYSKAISWLEKQKHSDSDGKVLGAEGQALYWIARSHIKLGHIAKAIDAYQMVVRNHPLSYYSLLALNRLRESHPPYFEALIKEIKKEESNEATRMQFIERDEYATPAFSRAIIFLQLGLSKTASKELRSLGFSDSSTRKPLITPELIDRGWAMALLRFTMGDYSQALWPTRHQLVEFKKHWPVKNWNKYWKISYPPGYWALIEKQAKAQKVPTELLAAIVREESGFDPRQESFANAIGLAQIIIPTAKRFVEGTGITVSRSTLQDPATNLTIGSRFISFLQKKWQGEIPLIVPSYNAGENAIARWIQERPSWSRDEWSEEIPYDETRRYSKRVISSYFAYRYLQNEEIPVFRN